jgi:hypothetical protein
MGGKKKCKNAYKTPVPKTERKIITWEAQRCIAECEK